MPKGGFAARRAKRKIAMLEKEEDDEQAADDWKKHSTPLKKQTTQNIHSVNPCYQWEDEEDEMPKVSTAPTQTCWQNQQQKFTDTT